MHRSIPKRTSKEARQRGGGKHKQTEVPVMHVISPDRRVAGSGNFRPDIPIGAAACCCLINLGSNII